MEKIKIKSQRDSGSAVTRIPIGTPMIHSKLCSSKMVS
jgi:hypothetical protein